MARPIMPVPIAYAIGFLLAEKVQDRMYRNEKKAPAIMAFYSDQAEGYPIWQGNTENESTGVPAIPTDAPCS